MILWKEKNQKKTQKYKITEDIGLAGQRLGHDWQQKSDGFPS